MRTTFLHDINSEKYTLAYPIEVQVTAKVNASHETEYQVECELTSWTCSTQRDALEGLGEVLVSTFEFLQSKPENSLSGSMLESRDLFRSAIVRRPVGQIYQGLPSDFRGNELLGDFIRGRRSTRDPKMITRVCAAIRKFAMSAKESQLNTLALALVPKDGCDVDAGIQLEIAKSVGLRFLLAPIDASSGFHPLTEQLAGLLIANSSNMREENHMAICINSLLAVVGINVAEHRITQLCFVFGWVVNTRDPAFIKLCKLKMREAIALLAEHSPASSSLLKLAVLNMELTCFELSGETPCSP